jgi:SNF2 family DNA or RNA helicase
MGTGKSKMLIDTLAWLYDSGRVDAALIVAPKGVYRNWIDKEIPEHMPTHVRFAAANWVADAKKEDVEAMRVMAKAANDLRIFVVNVEAQPSKRGLEAAYKFLLGCRAPLMAIDESTSIKNPTATRTKACIKLARYTKYRRIMSGEPAANSPLNLYSQFDFLDPHLLGYGSFFSFKRRFARLVEMSTAGNRKFWHVAGYQNLDELHKIIAPHSFIVKKVDCLDLPEKIYQTRDVEMGEKQRKAYEQMRQQAIVELSSLSPDTFAKTPVPLAQMSFDDLQGAQFEQEQRPAAPQVTANIVITQLLRLHQISCGFLRTDEGEEIVFDETNDRMENLVEVCQESAEKVIVWATYRRSIKDIVARLRKEFGDDSVVHYFGDTSNDDRRAAISSFQNLKSSVRYFVGNPQTAGYGLTLTEAGTVVYYANSYDLEKRGQSEDRAHRIGQRKSVVYVDLVARGTVDEKILKTLKAKKQLSEIVTASNWRRLFD